MFRGIYNKFAGKYINRETITYVLSGGATTIINYAVYYAARFIGIPYTIANIIAWIFAVAGAYLLNKLWVFQTKDLTPKALLREIGLFVSARLLSLGLEEGFLVLTVEVLGANDLLMKLIAAVFVIISNYILSKLFIFKKEKSSDDKKDKN